MKTRFSRRARGLSPGTALIGAVAVLLIGGGIILRVFFPGILGVLLTPLLHVGSALSNEEGPELHALEEENRTLRNENDALKARLKDVGADAGDPGEGGILVGVMARPPLSPYGTLVLDRGTESGVRPGAIVFGEGVPIGNIAEAGQGSARVLLYSSSGRRNEAWVGEERLPLTIVGEGAGAFSSEAPRELPIAVGSMVYLPGPGALPVGTVRMVESHPSSPSASIQIEPLMNPYTITWVRVMP